jgi:hypothetical protein
MVVETVKSRLSAIRTEPPFVSRAGAPDPSEGGGVGRRALCVGTRVADYDEEPIGMNDRHRGITGRRDVVFVNERDLASRPLKHGDLVDVSVVPNAGSQPGERVMRYLTAVAYKIAQARLQPIIPKPMPLVALDHYDVKSGTPSYKSTPVSAARFNGRFNGP